MGFTSSSLVKLRLVLCSLHDVHLIGERRITDRNLKEESVHLRLGQTVSTLLLNGILGGQNGIDRAHGIADAIYRDLPFLHHLKQGGLRLGWSSVYLVHQHDVAKGWPFVELELTVALVEDIGAQHIRRHDI